jgi:transcriptional regulator NrdR family protein
MPVTTDRLQLSDRRGLQCPNCGCGHFKVIYTRGAWGNRVLRRRECRHCGRRISTYEQRVGQAP